MPFKNPLVYIVLTLFIILLVTNLHITTEQHFVLLAKSFLNRQFTLEPINNDASQLAQFNGKYFWPLGPFPAVILLPFVFFIYPFYQAYISFPLTLINFFLLYKIARKLNLNHQKSLLLSIFFIFGSIYAPLTFLPASWYFAQVVACSFLIFAIWEFLNRKRYFLIGLFIALSLATRLNMIFASLFFAYFIFKKPFLVSNLLKFLAPIVTALILLGIYNYSRFQNPLESGYNLQLIPQDASDRRNIGLFSVSHIPTNLFFMILKGPEPVLNTAHELKPPYITFDPYGLSLFFISPILLLLYKANFKKELILISSLTALIMLIPIITYYGIGHTQISFRYALDFFPFIYLILADAAKKISYRTMTILVFWGVFFCLFFTFLYLSGFEN